MKRAWESIKAFFVTVIVWLMRAGDEADARQLRMDIWRNCTFQHGHKENFPTWDEFVKVYTIDELRYVVRMIKLDARCGLDPKKTVRGHMSLLLLTQPREWREFFNLDEAAQ